MMKQLDIISIENIQDEVIKEAIEIQQKFEIAIYDACFISYAIENKATLVTSDHKHHRKEIYNKILYLE